MPEQKPSLGRIVLVKYRDYGEHPGIVTAVHGPTMINARVFLDGTDNPPRSVPWLTSIPHEDEAGEGYGGATWRWPPREDAKPTTVNVEVGQPSDRELHAALRQAMAAELPATLAPLVDALRDLTAELQAFDAVDSEIASTEPSTAA